MWNLYHFLSNSTNAGTMTEYARYPIKAAYYPFFGDSNCQCVCPQDFLDDCGNPPLLITDTQIIDNSFIDSNFDRKLLKVATLLAQDILSTEIGMCTMSKLYNYILNQVDMTDKDGNTIDTQTLINLYVLPTLIFKIQSELAIPISLKEKNVGVINVVGQDFNHSLRDDITYLRQYYDFKYEFYLKRLRNKLRCLGILCFCNISPKINIVL